MTAFAISADIRGAHQKTSEIRSQRRVPGIVYGKTQDPISFTVDASDFLRLYRKAGESQIIDLKVGKVELEVLVHQTQKHPITGDFTHVDFYAITRGEKLSTHVSINFVGESAAAKEGMIIQEVLKGIEVKCLPRDLVDHFDADLSLIKTVEDSIKISDLGIDTEKYEISLSQDDVVVTCSAPRAAVEETQEDESADEAGEDTAKEEKK